MPDLSNLEAQLKASLEAIANKKAIILVKKIEGNLITVKHSRQGLLSYKAENWDFTEQEFRAKGSTIVYEAGVLDQINKAKLAPDWYVELFGKYIKITAVNKKVDRWDVRSIPGIQQDYVKDFYTLALVDGWRLFEVMSKLEKVVYSDEASNFIIKQIEQRNKIDEIALAKNWDYPVQLGGDITLRNFQNVTAAFGEATNFRCLYALEMGLGKTVIALANAIKNGFKTIIICPASLKANWAREVYKLSGERPVVFSGRVPADYDIMTLMTSKSKFFIINCDIVSNRTKYVDKKVKNGEKHEESIDRFLWIDMLNLSRPDLVIVDESHYYKNVDSNRSLAMRQLKVPRIIHMTGTPVLNRPGELWPILNSINPELFPSYELFLRQFTYDGKSAKNVEELKKSLKGIMIRRKQSDVIADLPPLNRITDFHELSNRAEKLYQKVLEGVYKAVAEYSAQGHESEKSITNILVQIGRLKQVCAIDKVESTAELAVELNDSASESPHNKVLIFSQFKACAFAIAQRLGHEALCFVERGPSSFETVDSTERDRLVQQFQNDPKIKYLVVTEKTAKEGHNITKAGFVVFNDLFWTPAGHEQGEGRAYMRVNDPHGITSYYRITDRDGNGIEEWIWELLAKKMKIIETVVEGVEGARDVSIAMELISRMKDTMWTRK